jgi:hypothetical protein
MNGPMPPTNAVHVTPKVASMSSLLIGCGIPSSAATSDGRRASTGIGAISELCWHNTFTVAAMIACGGGMGTNAAGCGAAAAFVSAAAIVPEEGEDEVEVEVGEEEENFPVRNAQREEHPGCVGLIS